eukprot:1468264-Amphidinium_carterae.1
MLPAGIPSLSFEGKVKSFIQRALAYRNFTSTSAPLTPLLDDMLTGRTPKSVNLRQKGYRPALPGLSSTILGEL